MAWGIDPTIQQAWDAPALDPALLKAIALIFVELLLVTAIALFFSTFSTPILSAALTFGFFIVGHFSTDLKGLAELFDAAAVRAGLITLYYALPNLSTFSQVTPAAHGIAPEPVDLAAALAYAAAWDVTLLAAATLLFARRDFK